METIVNYEKIERLMVERRLTQSDLARRLGVSRQATNYYFDPDRGIRGLKVLGAIARILEVSVKDLLV